MASFVENLQRLNRQERSYLLRLALGDAAFELDADFRGSLGELCGIDIPADAFVAPDYDPSWLYAATVLTSRDYDPGPYRMGGGIDKGGPEVIDLLIAFAADGMQHAIIVEAEGVNGWSNKQLLAKAFRLGDIFGFDAGASSVAWLRPHFVVATPFEPPPDILTDEWPAWMASVDGRPLWLRLPLAAGLLKLTVCDARGETGSKRRGFWKTEPHRLSFHQG